MSYCRFSSYDYNCDVYCYEDAYGGYTVHVAKERVAGDVPSVNWITTDTLYTTLKELSTHLDTCMRVPIGLKYDGTTLRFDTLTDMLHGLLDLAELGYIVPQGVIEAVMTDLEELDEG